MDDRFLHELNEEPRPEFARALRERLRATEVSHPSWVRGARPALAAAFAVVLAVALFTLPSVRASATAMLDLFRVRRFAAIGFDESRMEKLRALEGHEGLMVFDREEKLRDPGPPQYRHSIDEAAADFGARPLSLTYFPNGLKPDSVFVRGSAEARVSVSEAKLRALLQQLELGDVKVPAGLDGKWLEVKTHPIVVQKFTGGSTGGVHVGLIQAESPEVAVPAGIDVEGLAEIGLRVLGLDAGEAERIAKSTDWRTTLVVPVPMNASTFRQITVHGQPGLMVTTNGMSSDGKHRREGNMLMWTENGRVFGLTSNLGGPDAMQMAESVR